MNNFCIIKAEYFNNFQILFEFSNGEKHIVDLQDELWGEVFEPLKDIELFKKFKLNPWTIEWENGADFAPEYIYDLATKENVTH